MALPPWTLLRRLLRGWASLLLGGASALSLGVLFLASGAHEALLSRSLPYLLPSSRGRPSSSSSSSCAPLLPSAEAFLLAPAGDPCALRTLFLLVLVASAPDHAARRQAVRDTWGGVLWADGRPTRTLFALGVPSEPSLQAALEREAAQHGDLLQGRFLDTYANLTLKTLALLGWAATCCPGASFVVKADDDVFLNLPALARHLGALPSPPPPYLGRIHWWVGPNRDPRSRHHVPAPLYPGDTFPPYCSGTAYVLSGEAVPALLGAARHVPLVPLEDVFVGLCARQAGLAPQHLPHMAGSDHFPLDACCYREVLFSVHEVTPAAMVAVWEEVGTHEGACSAWQRALGLVRCKALAWLAA
ncbi:beta-1,3-galactosyltransferase 4 [Lacerta agilis]|uniref:beta-1,3-galactosyltransferase 4 n=1 Tax=Lacerta agilis TaxID=80427 RepID=UPI0014192130|nr:beta-1,3-galactosyltransferase 4 [Lacerta agilis]